VVSPVAVAEKSATGWPISTGIMRPFWWWMLSTITRKPEAVVKAHIKLAVNSLCFTLYRLESPEYHLPSVRCSRLMQSVAMALGFAKRVAR
jgi:hypothetical protein